MAKIKKSRNQEYYKVCVSKQPGAEQLIALIESLDGEAVKYSKNNEVVLVTISRAAKIRKKRLQKAISKAQKRSKLSIMQRGSQSKNHQLSNQLSMVVAK